MLPMVRSGHLSAGWLPFEFWPKRLKWRDWPLRSSALGLYLPLCEPRRIEDAALVYHSVFDHMKTMPGYRPPNLPPPERVRVEPSGPDAATSAGENE